MSILATGLLWLISGAPGSCKTSVAAGRRVLDASALSIDDTIDRILTLCERVAV